MVDRGKNLREHVPDTTSDSIVIVAQLAYLDLNIEDHIGARMNSKQATPVLISSSFLPTK